MGLVTLDYGIAFGGTVVRQDASPEDILSLLDNVASQLVLRPDVQEQFVDSVSVVDAVTINFAVRPDILQSFTESMSLTDVATQNFAVRPDILQTFAESIFFTDGTIGLNLGTVLFARIFAEVLAIQDSQQQLLGVRTSFADTLTLSDFLLLPLAVGATDALTLTDFVQLQFAVRLADTVTLSDAVVLSLGVRFTDTMTMADAILLPLIITTTAIPDATNGTPYSFQLQAWGGTPPYTWSISSGTLPTGLTLASDGTISGTPTQTISLDSVTFQVSDSG